MKTGFTFLLVAFNFFLSQGQHEFRDHKKMDLGGFEHTECSYPILSADQNTLFFVSTFAKDNVGGEKAGQDIWFSQRNDSSQWTQAYNLFALNNKFNNMVVGVNDIDSSLYLLNTYSSPNRWRYGISSSKMKSDSSWTRPLELNATFPMESLLRNFFINPEEGVIFLSMRTRHGRGNEDIYVYQLDGPNWVGPIQISKSVNSNASEIAPFYAPHLKTLFFASDGHSGKGSFDIYMSKKLGDTWTEWSEPINMGDTINSERFDAYFSTYPSGESFFASNKGGGKSSLYTGKLVFKTDEDNATDSIEQIIETIEPETINIDTIQLVEVSEDLEVIEEETRKGFAIQVIAMPRNMKPEPEFFIPLEDSDVQMSRGKDGLDRYYFGIYDNRETALKAMKSVREIGYKDAFVRALAKYKIL
ncbi:glycosyltransferase family protein [Reichenbachiella versicolor]|uniref:hypothetical protein n=1 Tax=Reichenbachiella versicolor TaxID=1821036 RepID=UPI000D6DF682|nr:hypothetical protein [Reichenbachiella versicolor]